MNETTTPECQYHLKGHLGNMRVTFTTKDETLTYTATFEDKPQVTEQAAFKNYSSETNNLYDHTDAGTTYDKGFPRESPNLFTYLYQSMIQD